MRAKGGRCVSPIATVPRNRGYRPGPDRLPLSPSAGLLTPLTARVGSPGRVLQQLASQGRLRDDGNRSNVTGRMVADWARAAGMDVVQTESWGATNQYNVTKYRDLISGLRKPLP